MSYTQEQIDRANQVNLEQFLRSQGEELIKSGREYRWKNHDSLTVKGNKWFRHSQNKGGYPIDFVMEFYNKTFLEAMQTLIGEAAVECAAELAPKAEFRLPPRCGSNDRIIKYLTEERKLPKDLVEEFIADGLIYEDAKHHNVVFVGKDNNGIPRYAHCRGTADMFRMDVAGSDKSYGFCYRGKGKELYVFEAPIDLLSHIALYPAGWREHSYLSLGGVSPKALERFLSECQDIESIYIATDNDQAGNNAAEKLAELISKEKSVYRFLPQAKDWNEDLINERNGLPTDDYVTIGVRKPKNPPKSVPIGHLNKASGTQSTYRGLGSIDIAAVVRSILFVGKVKDDPTTRVIVHEKSSLAPPGQALAFSLGDQKGFRWIGAYDISAEDLLAGGEGTKAELKQEQAMKLIYELLSDGREVSVAELNKEAIERGISERTVRMVRNSMKEKLESERRGKDWWIWLKRQNEMATD